MTEVWLRAALWLGLALISIRLRIATALSEIVVGTVARLVIGAFIGTTLFGTTVRWMTLLSATGAVFSNPPRGRRPRPGRAPRQIPASEVEAQASIELATRQCEELVHNLRRQAQERSVTLETHVLVVRAR